MALVLIVGLPCSGRSTRARQIATAFQKRIASFSLLDSTSLPIHSVTVISDDDVNNAKHLYASQALEKPARAAYLSACFRAIEQDHLVIADGGAGTNIKGFRYQLWCQVHVHAPPSRCRAWNLARKSKGEASYEEDTLESMLLRFEEPNAMTRWDSPLVFLPAPDIGDTIDTSESRAAIALPETGPAAKATSTSSFVKRKPPKLGDVLTEQRVQGASAPTDYVDSLTSRITPMRLTSEALKSLGSETQKGSNAGSSSEGHSAQGDEQSPKEAVQEHRNESVGRLATDSSTLQSALIDEIWTLATSGRVVKAPGVVIPQQRTTSNYMSILESGSQHVVQAIQTLQSTLGLPAGGGLVRLPLALHDDDDNVATGKSLHLELHLPPNRTVTIAALQRLRRQFVKLHSSGLSSGGEISGAAVGGDASTADGGRMLLRGQAQSNVGNTATEKSSRNTPMQVAAKRGKRAGAGDTEADVARRFVLWLEGAL